MCGIAGIFFGKGGDSLPPGRSHAVLKSALRTIAHRGPDDEGIWESSGREVLFGHRRLSIIDLSLGHQPMLDVSGNYAIVFNGEIYNHKELREELSGAGAEFQTQSDTEVILEAYKQWGGACLSRFDGMFAFALWDGRLKCLLLARDPFGEKPLYHARHEGQLLFASEPKALFSLGLPAQFEPNVLADFFVFRSVPAPNTMFRGVQKLPAGSYLNLGDVEHELKPTSYWTCPAQPTAPAFQSEAEATDELIDRLRSSVRFRLRSDVPVGAFLSGGVDSSLITALMCEEAPAGTQIRTFSVTVGDRKMDETPYQQMVARKYGTLHTAAAIGEKEMKSALRKWYHICDDLVADPSAVALYLLSDVVKNAGIKVMLSGEGADELFAGYHSYSRFLRMARLHGKLRAFQWSYPLARELLPFFSAKGRTASELLNPRFAFHGTSSAAASWQMDQMLNDSVPTVPHAWTIGRPLSPKATLRDLLVYDMQFRLADDILPRTDRSTMAHGVEARTPFLSTDFARWALQLPDQLKSRDNISKYILKKAAERFLPHELIHRRKISFELPVGGWLRGEFAPDVTRFLQEQKIAGIHYPFFSALWRQNCPSASLDVFWRWFAIESWHREWFP